MTNQSIQDALLVAKQYAWDFAQHVQRNTSETKAAADASLAALIAALSAAPASEQQPMTDETIIHLWDTRAGMPTDKYPLTYSDVLHFARALLAQQAADSSAPENWQRITNPGQVKVGDKLRFNIGDDKYSEKVKLILHAGSDLEEIIYNKRQNYYLITAMAIENKGSQKNVEFLSKPEGGDR